MDLKSLIIPIITLLAGAAVRKYIDPILPDKEKLKPIIGRAIKILLGYVSPIVGILWNIYTAKMVDKYFVISIAIYFSLLTIYLTIDIYLLLRKKQMKQFNYLISLHSGQLNLTEKNLTQTDRMADSILQIADILKAFQSEIAQLKKQQKGL